MIFPETEQEDTRENVPLPCQQRNPCCVPIHRSRVMSQQKEWLCRATEAPQEEGGSNIRRGIANTLIHR